MKKVIELFEPTNGVSVNKVSYIDADADNSIIYLRPSKTYIGTIKGHIDKSKIDDKYIFPKETIFVSTNGQGSHTYSYVSTFEFVPNSDVVALVPRNEMSLELKLFYAQCITNNRYKYSYGRKPKGNRLFELDLPLDSEIPKWLDIISGLKENTEIQIHNGFTDMGDVAIKTTENINESLVPITELFDWQNGLSSSKVKRYTKKDGVNFIPFIRPSNKQRTSVDAYVDIDKIDRKFVFPKGTLYVSTDGQGSHTHAYVSVTSFVPNSNTIILLPKREMTIREKLFYAFAITKNRYKFSYGRKPKGGRFLNIDVPEFPPTYINEDIF